MWILVFLVKLVSKGRKEKDQLRESDSYWGSVRFIYESATWAICFPLPYSYWHLAQPSTSIIKRKMSL